MRDARPEDAGRFGAVICLDNALPHLLGADDVRAALRAARLALVPGGLLALSVRDYDALLAVRPGLESVRLLGEAPERRVVLQVWTWRPDAPVYDLDLVILRETPAGWTPSTRRGTYRAWRRAELEPLVRAAGFAAPRWLEPAESGFYQPILVARPAPAPDGPEGPS